MQTRNANPPIQVTGRHVSVTEAMKEYCRRKVSTLHLDYPKIIEVQVILDVQKYRHQAEVILHCSNHITLEAKATSNDMYASIDQVVLRIARQMRKCKTRLMRNHRPGRPGRLQPREVPESSVRWNWSQNGSPLLDPNFEDFDEQIEAAKPEVIQTEKYPVKPMSPEEAALQMEFSKKQFLVFLNAKTEKVSVLYRRKHGDFGLIEPTFS
ncbi:MAG: ribosome-associated translation inhibitor RaiA [Verrucomicrobia bacterium]|nr:ribosome-associated translation inhibitor RaiA [Verrucomicrobiota bacterium]MBV9272964.1 ribosome-associated translation inhibitor RaiA [Verrucomicrobiota bacterium]